MTEKDRSHAPAFPVAAANNVHATGITMRDWFAGQALACFSARETFLGIIHDAHNTKPERALADAAYQLADMMLAARQDRE